MIFDISEPTTIGEQYVDNVNIFMQFFIHSNSDRHSEIVTCLQRNAMNPVVTKIYLLNERIYTSSELGIESDKIVQVLIEKRLRYAYVFQYINQNAISGYNIVMNSDIFVDESISNLFYSGLHLQKQMYALLRYECTDLNQYQNSVLFGPREDSQDTWIIHSNFAIRNEELKVFQFEFGKPGCDNKILYLMKLLGYKVLNDPHFIKTYHFHNTQIRDYNNTTDTVPEPYFFLFPANVSNSPANIQLYAPHINVYNCNDKLYHYIIDKTANNTPFIIPRISHIETICAVTTSTTNIHQFAKNNYQQLQGMLHQMKNNAGIKITSVQSLIKYSQMYLHAFQNCDMYANWAFYDNRGKHVVQHQEYIESLCNIKSSIYALTYDIFTFIHHRPWTLGLKGKRILFISPFEDSIREKIANRKEIYGIDLFPECEILTIKPPMTQGDEYSQEFDLELDHFKRNVDKLKDQYDIALVSSGGYGNLICDYLFHQGKSSIYVGGVLQMFWGINGHRWLNDRPDVCKLFMNSSWKFPKAHEKPKGYQNIENACYW